MKQCLAEQPLHQHCSYGQRYQLIQAIGALWAALWLVMLSGCSSSADGDVYSRDATHRSLNVQHGYVDSIRPVKIEGERGVIGPVSGSVLGGIAGSTVGGGHGQTVASAVGAIAGALAGGATQERLTREQGAEITVQLDNGELMSVVQTLDAGNPIRIGQRVRIARGNNGQARVMPLQAAPAR